MFASFHMETTHELICPYCGQAQTIFIDMSVRRQDYVEDCHVCCQPIDLTLTVDGEDDVLVEARRGDE
jgi:hypothetical protein